MAEADAYMPEYWPANRLIGVLEHVLIEAKQIIGQLKNTQIESLEAGKLTGQLTNSQIKEIEAAKIAGQLTNAQIESLEFAKLLGQAKSGQIENGAITTVKLAANAVTAEKILAEAITAVKLAAGAVTTEKLAAGSVTAEKMNVKELSAITGNIGVLTAGILKGVTFETSAGETVINKEGIQLLMGTTTAPTNPKRIRWKKEGTTSFLTEFVSYIFEKNSHFVINQGATSSESTASLSIGSIYTPKGLGAGIGFSAGEVNQEISMSAGSVGATLWNAKEESIFVSNITGKKVQISRGSATITFPGGTNNADIEVEHGFGEVIPVSAVATNSSLGIGLWQITVDVEKKKKTLHFRATFNTGFQPAAGTKVTVDWIAMT